MTGNIENLGLEKVGVKTERGAIVVDPLNRTNVKGIYAIGDVAGPPLLAQYRDSFSRDVWQNWLIMAVMAVVMFACCCWVLVRKSAARS